MQHHRFTGLFSRRPRRFVPTARPRLEALEDRLTPSFTPLASYNVAPTAALAADFNNDAVADLALNSAEVLLGHGDGTFDSPTRSGTYSSPLAVGDLDGDGNLDLVRAFGADLKILLGRGDGTFGDERTINVTDPTRGEYLYSVAAGDFNGDGRLDLAAVSRVWVIDGYDEYGSEISHIEGSLQMLMGNGDGAFSGPNAIWLGYGYHVRVTAGDFNRDSIDDLATTENGYYNWNGSVMVLLGDAGGAFRWSGQYTTGPYTGAVAAADVDGDLDADLVVAYIDGVGVLLGDGAGNFAPAIHAGAPHSASTSLEVADFNGDGNLDVATGTVDRVGDIHVLLGHGDGTLADPITQSLGAGLMALPEATADFDGDGLPDLAVTRYDMAGGGRLDVLLNTGDRALPGTLSIGDVTIAESNSGTAEAVFTVTRGGNLDTTVTVNYVTANGDALAGSDYVAAGGTLTFTPGETSKTITVLIKGDRLGEPSETFVVNLSNPTNAILVDGQGFGTIVDNEPLVSITDVAKKEGKRNQTTLFFFTVTLSAAYDQPVTMSFQTANGTARTSDNDYVAKSGTLTFAPGETTKTITIEVKGDSKKELSETFFLDLFDLSSNALFTKNRGVGTILNDD